MNSTLRIANPQPPVCFAAINQPLVSQLHAEGHRAYFADGGEIITDINGTEAEVRAYYRIGSVLNVGSGPEDNMQTVTALQFLDD